MYEFNGWVVLRYHTHDTNEELQNRAVNELLQYLALVDSENVTHIKRRNGLDSFLISGLHNHYQSYVIEIFKWISERFIGAYGLLYIHDDEDFTEEYDNTNKFSVWKLARGSLIKLEGEYLSPYVPTVEDEFDASRND